VVVLVGCSGCRSRREASGPNANPFGSSHPASCSGGEGASEARSRWQSRGRGGGLAVIPHSLHPAQAGWAGASRFSWRKPVGRDRGESLGRGGRARGASRARGRAGAEERALVEGRRPGFDEVAVFDETAAEAGPGGFAGRARPRGRIPFGGAATEGVRGYATGSARGRERRRREAQRGGALDRGSARTAQRPVTWVFGAQTSNTFT